MDTLLLLKNLTVVAKSCLVIQHKRPPPPQICVLVILNARQYPSVKCIIAWRLGLK